MEMKLYCFRVGGIRFPELPDERRIVLQPGDSGGTGFGFQEDQIERSRLNDALDSIHRMFGDNSVLRASALLERSTAMRRNEQIGGHRR